MAIIKISDGNAFKLRVTALVNSVPADFNVVANMIVNFVRRGRLAQPHGIDSSGRVVIANDGSLARGIYGVEITGYHDGKPWRHYIKDAFKIVDENEDADTPTVVDDVPVYDLSDNMSFGGDGVTAEYVNAAISAHDGDENAHPELKEAIAQAVEGLRQDMEDGLADAGKVNDVKVNGESVLDPVTKNANITIPEKVSDLDNDAGFQTASQVNEKVAAAAVNEVNVEVDGTSGNPSVTKTYANGVLGMAFSGLKGEKGDKLTWDDLTPEQKASLQGKQGATGVYDATTQDFLTTLESTIGSSQTKTMTQGSITEEVLPIKNAPAMRVPGKESGYLNNSGVRNNSNNFFVTDYVMLEEGQTKIHIVSGVWKPSSYSQVCFYSEPNEASFVSYINEGTQNTERTNKDYDIPANARYCRFTVKPDVDAIISIKGSLIKRIEDIEANNTSMASEVAEVKQTQAENTETLNKIVDMFDINVMATPCAEGKDGKLLSYNNTTGIHSENSVSGKGITDFIPVTAGSSILLVSGFYVGAGYVYRLAEFYTEASTGSEIGVGLRPETTGAISNMRIAVPEGAAYMRLSLESKNTPGIIDMSVDFDVTQIKQDIDELKNSKHDVFGQIKNNPLPVKATTEELNILLIGSSYGIDTIDALAAIGRAAGVKINTWNMYISGGSVANYLAKIESGETVTTYYHYHSVPDGQTRDGHLNKTVYQAVTGKAWDVVVLMNSANDSYNIVDGVNTDFAKLVAYVKENATNPRVTLAMNCTWTAKARQDEQDKVNKVVCDLMRQTGIDIVIPCGAAISKLKETYEDDVYRDSEHLNAGIGRFTTGCTMYMAIAYYVFGVPLAASLDITGCWTNPELNPDSAIQITSENRATCIECAKKANANRFLM